MSNVPYKKEFLDLLKNLTSINNSIILDDMDGDIFISRFNESQSVVYQLKAPKEYFNTDTVAFYNFNEFSQILSVFQNPVIERVSDNNIDKITISEGKSKINYVLTDPEVLVKGKKKAPQLPDKVFTLNLTIDEIRNIKKMISILKASNINFIVNDNILTVSIGNDNHNNSYSKEFTLETSTENYSGSFKTDVFMYVPDNSYVLNIAKNGESSILTLKYVHEVIDLNFYVAEVK